jgi:hypothetical protein
MMKNKLFIIKIKCLLLGLHHLLIGIWIEKTIVTGLTDLTLENIKNNSYASILSSILTVLGAILMWKLRKIGFWIYVLGTVIGVVAPVIIFPGNIIAVILSIGLAFFGALFVVLYAINKKQLVY